MLEFFSDVPIWLWVLGGLFAFVLLFGDTKLWDFEAKFPRVEGVGRGNVEFECSRKKGARIECEFDLEKAQRNKPLEIYLDGLLIFTVPGNANTGRFELEEPLQQFAKPQEGGLVTVKLDGRDVFSAPLVLD